MNKVFCGFDDGHHSGQAATHPIAQLARRLAVLLVVAGANPAASSRLARQRVSRTLGCVQQRNQG